MGFQNLWTHMVGRYSYEGVVPFLAHVVVTDDFNFTFDLLFKKDAIQSDDFRKNAKSSKTN